MTFTAWNIKGKHYEKDYCNSFVPDADRIHGGSGHGRYALPQVPQCAQDSRNQAHRGSQDSRQTAILSNQHSEDKLDQNNADTLAILIDNKRNYILNFTSKAVDMSYPLTKEQYNRFFIVYDEYEEIIKKNNTVNGQVDVAHEVVNKSFEERLKKHAFIEDRGYEA